MNAQEAIGQARVIVAAMKVGAITYDEARIKCEPLFDIANKRMREIAKKYNKRFTPINFAAFAR